MANVLFAYPNRVDAGVLSGGAWSASMPVTQLQDRVIGLKARSNAATLAATQCDLDLLSAYPIRVLALAGHNLTSGAKYRLRGSNTPGDFVTVVEYDSGWQEVWPSAYIPELLEWEDDQWWLGQPTDVDIGAGNRTLVHILPAAVYARAWRLELDDQSNTAGYVEAGRLFVGDGWQPVWGFDWRSSIAYEDLSGVEEARSGAEYFDERPRRRTARMTFESLADADAWMRLFEMHRKQGVTGEIMLVWDPDDTLFFLRRSFLARQVALSPIEVARVGESASIVTLRELI